MTTDASNPSPASRSVARRLERTNESEEVVTAAQVTISADEATDLPMPPHHVTRDEDGRPTVTCDAPPLAKCRVVCAESCESEVWPCGGYEYDYDNDREIERQPHRMTDGGYCNVILFWDDFDECAEDSDDPALRSYEGPVIAAWDDDTYVWTPITAAANDGSHAHG